MPEDYVLQRWMQEPSFGQKFTAGYLTGQRIRALREQEVLQRGQLGLQQQDLELRKALTGLEKARLGLREKEMKQRWDIEELRNQTAKKLESMRAEAQKDIEQYRTKAKMVGQGIASDETYKEFGINKGQAAVLKKMNELGLDVSKAKKQLDVANAAEAQARAAYYKALQVQALQGEPLTPQNMLKAWVNMRAEYIRQSRYLPEGEGEVAIHSVDSVFVPMLRQMGVPLPERFVPAEQPPVNPEAAKGQSWGARLWNWITGTPSKKKPRGPLRSQQAVEPEITDQDVENALAAFAVPENLNPALQAGARAIVDEANLKRERVRQAYEKGKYNKRMVVIQMRNIENKANEKLMKLQQGSK